MSAELADEFVIYIDEAKDQFVAEGERDLESFYLLVAGVLLAARTPAELSRLLVSPASNLLSSLTGRWYSAVDNLFRRTHQRLGLPVVSRYTLIEARTLMTPAVNRLVNAAILAHRVADDSRGLQQSWERQYQRGGVFTSIRGHMRGSSAGTLNTLVNAAVIQSAQQSSERWILGAYNPLDERTEPLDRSLCTNTGRTIITNAGRRVTSIAGRVGKYSMRNAWVPGPPRMGGDTHDGCRCWLIPERQRSLT